MALARLPRGSAPEQASLIRALAEDLELGFDPLAAELGAPWTGPRPKALAADGAWRSTGDTVERLETLARRLVAGTQLPAKRWRRAAAVIDWIDETLRPAVVACGDAEIGGLLRGLSGR